MPVEVTERLKMVVVKSHPFGGEYVPIAHQLTVLLKRDSGFLTNKRSTITRSEIMLHYDLLTARTLITLPERCLNLKYIERRGRAATQSRIVNPYKRRRETKAVAQYKHSESKHTYHDDPIE
jgi:hypothetical protein